VVSLNLAHPVLCDLEVVQNFLNPTS